MLTINKRKTRVIEWFDVILIRIKATSRPPHIIPPVRNRLRTVGQEPRCRTDYNNRGVEERRGFGGWARTFC